MDINDIPRAEEIVHSAHETGHAVASVLLNLPFHYVTLDDEKDGPHVMHHENWPRPIPYFRGDGTCCGLGQPICDACASERVRAEGYIMMAMCGSIGVEGTGCDAFGYGSAADMALVVEFCQVAFGDRAPSDLNERISPLFQQARALMVSNAHILTAVAKELRSRRRLTEDEVREIVRTTNAQQQEPSETESQQVPKSTNGNPRSH